MKIEVQSKRIKLSKRLKLFLLKRLEFAFNRFDDQIQKVKVRLDDVNGPKGGMDKYCQIHLRLDNHEDIVVKGRAQYVEAAIANTATRSVNTFTRRLKKRRSERYAI